MSGRAPPAGSVRRARGAGGRPPRPRSRSSSARTSSTRAPGRARRRAPARECPGSRRRCPTPLGGALGEPHGRHVEERREQLLALAGEQRPPLLLGRARDVHDGVDALADQPLLARGLERARDLAAHFEQALPLGAEPLVDPLAPLLGEGHEVHALGLAAAGDVAPHLVGGEAQDGRQEPRERRQHLEADRLRRAPLGVVGRRHVEPVLDDVEVERREVHRAEVVRRVEHDVELVLVVGPARRARSARPGAGAPSGRSRPSGRRRRGRARDRSRRACRGGSGTCSVSAGRRR